MASRASAPTALYVLLACSIGLNVVQFFAGGSSGESQDATVSPATQESDGDDALAEGVEGVEGEGAAAAAGAGVDAPAPAAVAEGDWIALGGPVNQSLARTFQGLAGADGDALVSVYTRLFVWDLDMRRDLLAGDSVAVVWRKAPDGLPEVAAGRLRSKKLGRVLEAYRWQAPGDQFASYWHLDGSEAPLRLKDGPLRNYEQITSLLKDRPTHKGMDFKTPVGTEVVSPKPGTVTRVNWNWGANGNCIEIRYEDGVLAKFLHLSENRVKEGDRVTAGQVVALSGNTGHSTAPHLHYQLDRGDKTVDPLDYHGTERRSLTPEQTAAMKRDVAGWQTSLESADSQ